MLQFPARASLAPGQVTIVANNAGSFHATYGFYPNYEMTASSPAVPDMRKVTSWASGTVNLDNSGDEVLILDGADSIADSMSWGNSSWAFYPPCPAPDIGWSLERYPAYIDTNSSNDWRLQPNPAPGVVDLTPPTSTPTPTSTSTASSTITPSQSPSPTITLTPSPTETSTFTPIDTRTPTPTYTPTFTTTPEYTSTPTLTTMPTVTPTPTQTPTNGWLLISEVLYDPFDTEPDGEWIELYNAGSAAIDISNYKVGDEETPGGFEGMYQFPINASILPGQVIIIADRADVFTNTYGFYPDYEFTETDTHVPTMIKYDAWALGEVNLSNLGDEVLVLNESDSLVDAISWGNSTWAFDPACPVVAEGHSLERFPANVDTDTAADWIDQAVPNPGQVNLILRTCVLRINQLQ